MPRKSQTAGNKFDPANQYRHEIEARTAQGETCEQIASALRAKGVDISNKTISRRRVEWGLRQRPFNRFLGQKAPKQRPKHGSSKGVAQNARKTEIEARTQHGETAEQIAAAMQQAGYELKRGASTILRLQTTWGFIPHDADRTRGRVRKSRAPKESRPSKREVREQEREAEKEANKQQRSGTLHYPTNCSFGPKKRVNCAPGTTEDDDDLASDDDMGPLPIMDMDDSYGQPPQPQSEVSVAAELMSVEFLVDLATSTLGAATNLKDMLLAYQDRRPVPGSQTGLPPTSEDMSTARRKVREAAAVMHDLAVEPGTGS